MEVGQIIAGVVGGLFLILGLIELGLEGLAYSAYLSCASTPNCSVVGVDPNFFVLLLVVGIAATVGGLIGLAYAFRSRQAPSGTSLAAPARQQAMIACRSCQRVYPLGKFRFCPNCGADLRPVRSRPPTGPVDQSEVPKEVTCAGCGQVYIAGSRSNCLACGHPLG